MAVQGRVVGLLHDFDIIDDWRISEIFASFTNVLCENMVHTHHGADRAAADRDLPQEPAAGHTAPSRYQVRTRANPETCWQQCAK